MLDCHTHSTMSFDGRMEYEDLLRKGKSLGLDYLAVTEHCDRDYYFGSEKDKSIRQIDLDAYLKKYLESRRIMDGCKTKLLFGIEIGYCKEAEPIYQEELKKYPFDVILHSVHSVAHSELAEPVAYVGKTEDDIICGYLDAIYNSVCAPYDFDVITHIGYPMRYVPYPEKHLYRKSAEPYFEKICSEIIKRDKCLECNGKVLSLPTSVLPEVPILKMYYDMGGRKISYGSDAHDLEMVASSYERVAATVKSIGFTNWTVYKNREPIEVKI